VAAAPRWQKLEEEEPVFNSIIVAVELRSNAHRALPVARSLAEVGNLPIQALTVSAPWMSKEIDTHELERLADEHALSPRSRVILHDDDAGRAIAQHLNNCQGSLLVMATTAKAPARRHFLGTVTESVLARVDGPVLLIGPHVPPTCDLTSPTLVACVDETDAADAALPVIADWVHTFGGGRPCCAEVIPVTAGSRDRVRTASRLGQYAARLAAHDVDASWKVLHGGDPTDRLEGFAATEQNAVLVVASVRWTGWDTHRHSATRSLVHSTTRPVLVVPARRSAALSNELNPTLLVDTAR
jgi:nucleotide-binding universal stress UspA family protein